MSLERVKQFAAALDREDWATARAFLAEHCAYQCGTERVHGPEAILASYRESAAWGRQNLESVRYESAVREGTRGFVITYTDVIEHRGAGHRYRCEQRVLVGDDGLVAHIEHRELPGEKEALDAYWQAIGVKRGR